ncbi:MAG TPA: hypothetical protein VFC29_17365, partial [Candidatus Limnocylindrales bacterium]|nr:hypothetical protein [Candidatus Limnocylindrales bacterium]
LHRGRESPDVSGAHVNGNFAIHLRCPVGLTQHGVTRFEVKGLGLTGLCLHWRRVDDGTKGGHPK